MSCVRRTLARRSIAHDQPLSRAAGACVQRQGSGCRAGKYCDKFSRLVQDKCVSPRAVYSPLPVYYQTIEMPLVLLDFTSLLSSRRLTMSSEKVCNKLRGELRAVAGSERQMEIKFHFLLIMLIITMLMYQTNDSPHCRWLGGTTKTV